MMNNKVIATKNGYHFIIDENDLLESIRKELGDDFYNCAGELIGELRKKADYTKAKIETDLESYEGSLEENRDAMQDSIDILEKVIESITGKNKDKNIERINKVISLLNDQI